MVMRQIANNPITVSNVPKFLQKKYFAETWVSSEDCGILARFTAELIKESSYVRDHGSSVST